MPFLFYMNSQKSIPFEIIHLNDEGYHLKIKSIINNISIDLIVDTGASQSAFDIHFIQDNLSELEDMLDHKTFFRANRQFIINIEAIAKFKPYTKGKIILDITPSINQEIIISQENASKFKQWISN